VYRAHKINYVYLVVVLRKYIILQVKGIKFVPINECPSFSAE